MATLYLYPKWLRIWHFINAVLCLLLILTGISLQYTNPDFNFIRFDLSISIHNVCGILLTGSYVMFLLGNFFTPNGKYYGAKRKGYFKRLQKQLYFYTIGIFKKEDAPFPVTQDRKFNPLQKLSYIIIMFIMMPVIFITGWSLLFPEIIINKIFGWSGLHIYDLLHIISGFIISIFLLVHVYFCTIGANPRSNFIAMITGWHRSS